MSKKSLTPEDRRNEAAQELYQFIADHPAGRTTNPQEVLFYLAILRELTLLHLDGDVIDTESSEYERGYAAGIRAARRDVYLDTFADFCADPGLYDAIEDALAKFMDTFEPTTDRDVIQRQTLAIYDGIMETVPQIDTRTRAAMMHTRVKTLSQFGLMKDKVNKTMLDGVFNTYEDDGQLRYEWHINKAGKSSGELVPVIVGTTPMAGHTLPGRPWTGKIDAVFTATANLLYDCEMAEIPPPWNLTPEDIYRRMNGINDNHPGGPTTKQKNEINAIIDYLMFSKLTMDISAEIKAGWVTLDDERLAGGVYEAPYLLAERLTFFTEKGRSVPGYAFYKVPFLLTYNLAIGHVILVPSEMLDVSDTVQNGDYVTEFKMYLLREIGRMYKRDRPNNIVKFNTIYESEGIDPPRDRVDRSKYSTENAYETRVRKVSGDDRKKIEAILLSWKNRDWIKDYKPFKEGRAYAGEEIILNPDNYEEPRQGKIADKKQKQ